MTPIKRRTLFQTLGTLVVGLLTLPSRATQLLADQVAQRPAEYRPRCKLYFRRDAMVGCVFRTTIAKRL